MFLNLTGLAAHSERKKNPVQLTATRCQPLMMLKVVSQKCEPPSLLPQSPLSLPLLHSIFFLSVPSHPLPPLSLSLSEPQSALYKTFLHTQIYKHLRSHHSASEPCVRKNPSTHLKRLNSRHLTLPEWAGEDSFLLPHLWTVFFALYFSSSLAADNGSIRRRFVCLFAAAEKIKDCLTWGETFHKESWRPHVCGLPPCCCQSSLWWVKYYFDLTFFKILTLCNISVINICSFHKKTVLQVSFN